MIAVSILSLRSAFFPRWVAWPAIVVGTLGLISFVGFVAIVPGRIIWLLVSGVVMLQRARSNEEPSVAVARPSTLLA